MTSVPSLNQIEPIGYFWKIKKDAKTVAYLMGSVHIGPSDVARLNSRMQKCFLKASTLAVEIDCTREELQKTYKDIQAYQDANVQSIIFDAYISLQKLYPEEAKASEFNSKDEIVAFVNKYHTQLMAEAGEELQCSIGADFYLIAKAKERQIPVESLEELDEARIECLKSLDDADLKMVSLKTLASHDALQINNCSELRSFYISRMSEMRDIIAKNFWSYWKEGQAIPTYTYFSHNEEKSYHTIRNENIANRIIDLINKGGLPFCCIGCGHTMGRFNVRQFLEENGYTSTRVLIREIENKNLNCVIS